MTDKASFYNILRDLNKTVFVKTDGQWAHTSDGDLKGMIPQIHPNALGSSAFRAEYGLKMAYVGGAMVGGISSVAMVTALTEGGALGVFGASGLPPSKVEDAVVSLKQSLGDKIFGCCLINTPHDPTWEEAVAEIYLKRQVRLIEASAFMQLTPTLVRYRLSGATRRPDGSIYTPNRIMAKVSRVELARRFFSPASDKLVAEALRRGWITQEEAELAPFIPVAGDLTAEADSGGHTDFRPALALWPAMVEAAKQHTIKYNYATPLRVGAAGGIGTPWALLAAHCAGASYFVTGSINQSCQESGLAPLGRELLAKASQVDVVSGPAADMFEMGAKVQVLKFGTLYAMRAQKLAEAYRLYEAIEDIPPTERETLESQVFKQTLDKTWQDTKNFFLERDPSQVEKAESNSKHKMALVFRWYLGQATRWAIFGVEERRTDWQIFCGPSQGAFNEWAKGTIYEKAENRKVMDLALNLLYGAAVLMRLNMAKTIGAVPYNDDLALSPQPAADLAPYFI
ncbi:MAG: PfaD family polyunsaturated fatty acid/polyketide biosynthesis protein [Candidatus Adiutrix sp.]